MQQKIQTNKKKYSKKYKEIKRNASKIQTNKKKLNKKY